MEIKILIFIGLLINTCYCFNSTKYFLRIDERINSLLQNPVPGTDQSLLKDLIQFIGINYHIYEAIQHNESETITSIIRIIYAFMPKCVEFITNDEYNCICENNKQTFNWSVRDLIYFDSFAKDEIKLWDKTIQLIHSRSDFMTYTNKNETNKYLNKLLGITQTNISIKIEDYLACGTLNEIKKKIEETYKYDNDTQFIIFSSE